MKDPRWSPRTLSEIIHAPDDCSLCSTWRANWNYSLRIHKLERDKFLKNANQVETRLQKPSLQLLPFRPPTSLRNVTCLEPSGYNNPLMHLLLHRNNFYLNIITWALELLTSKAHAAWIVNKLRIITYIRCNVRWLHVVQRGETADLQETDDIYCCYCRQHLKREKKWLLTVHYTLGVYSYGRFMLWVFS